MHLTGLKALVVGVTLLAFPAAAGTSDGLITSKTKLSLWTTAGVRSTAVHVDTNDGIVTLYGKVPTADQKAIAEKTAREIAGVRGVNSLLQVVPESDEGRMGRSDQDTKEKAEKLLKADPSLKNSSISVKSVDKGLVLLTGKASTFSDHLRAISIVDRLPGVRRVASEIKGPEAFQEDERVIFLAGPEAKQLATERSSASDMRVSAAVKLRLLTAAQVPSTEISVDTEDGVVTLFGMVPTADVKTAATTEASKADGVVRVVNQLEVVASPQRKVVDAKDADITRDLALAIKDRPELKSVTTSVKNGAVQVSGSVSSGWDELNAIRVIRRVAGVRTVENQLKVDGKIKTSQR
jgi:hyperosmotically inducible protein